MNGKPNGKPAMTIDQMVNAQLANKLGNQELELISLRARLGAAMQEIEFYKAALASKTEPELPMGAPATGGEHSNGLVQ